MTYTFKTNISNKNNYGSKRDVSKIKYIVIHYTGNDGDSDESNCKYFKNNIIKASAHYFIDDDSVTQSVPDNYIAWSVGGNRYSNYKITGGASYYGLCTNTNSINIELCDNVKNGVIYPSTKTIKNAIKLTKTLMKKYNIPASRVIRHFDVTGKSCPAYWCGTTAKNKKWLIEFWNNLNSTETKTTVTNKTNTFIPYKVKITANTLNIRKGAGTNYGKNGTVKKNEIYTIVGEATGKGATTWLKLKSGRGFISSNYTKKI